MSKRCMVSCVIGLGGLMWSGALLAQCPDTVWTRTYGGTADDEARSVRQTADGGYIIAGSTASFGAGGADVYLVKTDANGGPLWTRTYGGTGYDRGYSVRQTTDGGYIIAGFTYSFGVGGADVYLVKTDANGGPLWTRTYGGTSNDVGYSVQQTTDGGYIITGATLSFHGIDMYLIKTDEYGDTVWTRTYGGTGWQRASSVQQTTDGGYIMAGYKGYSGGPACHVYVVKTDAGGDTMWTRTFEGAAYSVQQTTDGGYIIAGQTGCMGGGPGSADVYLIKTDAGGDTVWTRTYRMGAGTWDVGLSVEQTTDDGYIVAGYTDWPDPINELCCFYVAKTDAEGDTLWTMACGSVDSYGISVQQTFDGGYIAAGLISPYGSGIGDMYLIKIEDPCSSIPAVVDLSPDVLNPRSRGRWVTCYIELPPGYDPENIDVSTVLLNGTVLAEEHPTEVGDYDHDGIAERMVKFPRPGVIGALLHGEEVEVQVSGEVAGQRFQGADTIRVLMPKLTYPNGGEILEAGTECEITWEVPSGYVPDTYGIYYTMDSGKTWEVIAEGVVALSHNWMVPDVASAGCRVQIEAYDVEGIMGYDESDGAFTICSGAGIPSMGDPPSSFALHACRPNPFRAGTSIRFDLPESRQVRLTIHDVQGHLVREMISEELPGRSHKVVWDGMDASGRRVSGGIYFISLRAGTDTATSKVVMVP